MNNQFKKGVLELCVLELVRRKDFYGYELVQEISRDIDISEGALYPILRRLSKEGIFETYLEESDGGPPRKYYHITGEGKEQAEAVRREWEDFLERVGRILDEGVGVTV
ncbi:MAG: PadR family transcriptional regulator [Spirochaetaceae bacterium]|nr:PadR family transcriptional regulator [Spirochaetaceae bacterium]